MKVLTKFFWLSLVLCVACGNDEGGAVALASLEISANSLRIDVDEATTLSIIGKDQSGNEVAISSEIVWSASNTNASVNQDGLVTGLVIGDVEITATVGEVSETIAIRIWDSTAPRTEIYVTDAARFNNGGPYKVIRYDEDGSFAETVISSGLSWPQDIVFLEEDGIMLVSNLSSNKIEKFDIETGERIGTFATISNGPTRMKVGSDDLLYVLQWNNSGAVLRYELDGTFVDEFTSTGVNRAIGMDWDASGNLYVSSFQGFVQKFDSNGDDQGQVISANVQGPTNIWITADSEMLVLDWTGGLIKKFNLSGSLLGTVTTGLSKPEGIDMLPNGKFVIGNGGNGTLKVLGEDGSFESDLFASGFGGLQTPNGVVIRLVNQ